MKLFNRYSLLLGVSLSTLLVVLTNCSPRSKDVEFKQNADFFNVYVNKSADLPQAEEKISSLKLLATEETNPLRLVLFDNNKFYYQVDRLGSGEGVWEYKNGALQLVAIRPLFDLAFTITTADAEGNETLVQYTDRFGLNSYLVQFRNPTRENASEKVSPNSNEKSSELRSFSSSNKGI
ncbi:MAG: transposase [Bdellovibrionota bacterium]